MKVKLAKEKSEYSHCIMKFINLKLPHNERYAAMRTMLDIEQKLKLEGDKIVILITTVNTSPPMTAAPMTEEDIKKSS